MLGLHYTLKVCDVKTLHNMHYVKSVNVSTWATLSALQCVTAVIGGQQVELTNVVTLLLA